MDSLKISVQELINKCEILENSCNLQLRKDSIQIDLKELRKNSEDVNKLLKETKELYEIGLPEIRTQFHQTIGKMRDQQLIIINLLLEIKKQKFPKNAIVKRVPQHSITPLQIKNLRNDTTPRMYLSEYVNSPYVKFKNLPLPIQFINFEIKINLDTFESIPKYMRGRESLVELQQFLDEILIPCFNEKYQLLYKKREGIKNGAELRIWNAYKVKSSLFPSKNFICQDDLIKKLNKAKIDRSSLSKLTMLRHIGVIQIEHKEHSVFYIWVENS